MSSELTKYLHHSHAFYSRQNYHYGFTFEFGTGGL